MTKYGLTERQLEMLRNLEDGDPTDYADFIDAGTLAWRNRERVIESLIRRGLVDDDLKLTEEGRDIAISSKIYRSLKP